MTYLELSALIGKINEAKKLTRKIDLCKKRVANATNMLHQCKPFSNNENKWQGYLKENLERLEQAKKDFANFKL